MKVGQPSSAQDFDKRIMEQSAPDVSPLKFKHFSVEEMSEFADLGILESVVTNATVKDVLKTVMDPHWWVKKVGKSSTEISAIEKISKVTR